MSVPSNHIHITEREVSHTWPDGRPDDAAWEDCTFCSGLEFFRLAYDDTKPATHTEAEAIRAASGKGPLGGSNMNDLANGIKARYGVTIPARVANTTFPKAGQVAVVQGSMSAFGPDHPLSKWDPSFDGGHAVCVINVGGVFYWCDPEAPTGAAVPVTISSSDLTKYVKAFPGGQNVIAPIKTAAQPPKDPMYPITSYLPGYTGEVKINSNIRSEPHIAATKFRTTTAVEKHVLIGTVAGDTDPANGSTVWYMWWANGRYEFTAKDNVPTVTAPSTAVDDGYTKATQDAAVAAATESALKQGRAEQYTAIATALKNILPEL